MKRLAYSLLVIGLSCGIAWKSNAQSVDVIKLRQLLPMLSGDEDTVYIVNFWATWCKPCVEELPHFAAAADSLRGQKVQFVMVSLDFARNLQKDVIPFLRQHRVPGRVVLLDETKYNDWLSKIHPNWGGTIPITTVVSYSRSLYIGSSVGSAKELLSYIRPFIMYNK
jgi:thiol-disulfide isomerase/thioredoxin